MGMFSIPITHNISVVKLFTEITTESYSLKYTTIVSCIVENHVRLICDLIIFYKLRNMAIFQALAPHMQPPVGDPSANRSTGRLLGPSLGDQKQGSFSINLWRNAFQDAFQRLCPVRAAGHECGCLPVLARMVCF